VFKHKVFTLIYHLIQHKCVPSARSSYSMPIPRRNSLRSLLRGYLQICPSRGIIQCTPPTRAYLLHHANSRLPTASPTRAYLLHHANSRLPTASPTRAFLLHHANSRLPTASPTRAYLLHHANSRLPTASPTRAYLRGLRCKKGALHSGALPFFYHLIYLKLH
jgi:hypothetical protein